MLDQTFGYVRFVYNSLLQ
ncbi:hypothetical protein C5469_01215 [Photorhabdus cinerea]|uniref:Transposase putative helix-turn-helix domain-containing protein n=1 Tax=Photorhabdus cinerea TaxID=471575 RepID=A0A7X5TEN1_9GAMM|nr:hypothetical protein [Photorhabdus cinerea]